MGIKDKVMHALSKLKVNENEWKKFKIDIFFISLSTFIDLWILFSKDYRIIILYRNNDVFL